MIFNRQDPLRKLARSSEYQHLFSIGKDISGIQLFNNTTDFSKIQLEFLYWTSLYNRLYTELAYGDSQFLTKEIIEDDFSCDCYLIWEQHNRKNKNKEKDASHDKRMKNKKFIKDDPKIPSVIFTQGGKK